MMKSYLIILLLSFFIPAGIQAQMKHDMNVYKRKDLNYKSADGFVNKLILPSAKGGVFGIFEPVKEFEINVKTNDLKMFAGNKTQLLTYETTIGNIKYINPVIKVRKASRLKIILSNSINEGTIIHWHGIFTESRYDGLPHQNAAPGMTYDYELEIFNRSGTYWYHPHPHKRTARQLYMGMAGFFIIEDDDEMKLNDSLDLELGINDIPLIIQDKRFDENNVLLYDPDMNEQFMGFYAENIIVNFTPKPYTEVGNAIYRLRLLNGSNARTYRIAFVNHDDKMDFHVIGTDGGLLDRPYPAKEVFLSAGERIDVLIDFGKVKPGDSIYMKSLQFDPMHNEGMMMHGMNMMNMDENAGLPEGDEFYIMKFNVKAGVKRSKEMPSYLSRLNPVNISGTNNVRRFVLSLSGMQWLINGMVYRMGDYPVAVKADSKEIWEFYNSKQSMPHPMHIHGVHFRVIERMQSPDQIKKISAYDGGRLVTDIGWKDTVLVWPDETVRILVDFTGNYTGNQDYIFHCHILEHEDNGMMINYRIVK